MTQADVNSRMSWQSAGVSVEKGHTLDIAYRSGQWTVDGTYSPVGPNGYDAATDQRMNPMCKYDLNEPFAYLLGQLVGPDGKLFYFPVGAAYHLVAPISGTLYLRINDNDACTAFSDGVVSMTISRS
jgi:hypothetical protein